MDIPATSDNIPGTLVLRDASGNLSAGSISAGVGCTISGSSSSDGLRITQTGSGNALLVEDESNPDATPFIIRNNGELIQGHTTRAGFWFSSSIAPKVYFVDSANGGGANAVGQNTPGVFQMIRSNGTNIGDRGIVSNGDIIGVVRFSCDDGVSSGCIPAAQIFAQVDQTPGTSDMPSRLVFGTTAAAGSLPTERVRIDSSGNVGIGTGAVNASAILHCGGTTKGFLPPVLTTAQRDAIAAPAEGLMIYNTTTNKLNFYNGTAWEAVTSA